MADIQDGTGDLPAVVDRHEELVALREQVLECREPCLHLYGPKGAGKTLLIRHVLQDRPAPVSICTLSCLQYDTQYKALTALCNAVTDGEFSTGYHTAQLYTAFTEALTEQEIVIVLDDIDFLLLNDGNDLLYTLSRLEHRPQLVLISANHPDVATELDERTYSSLLPRTVEFSPYTEPEARHILSARAPDWIDLPVTEDAITRLAAATTNICLGTHWLRVAEEVTDGPLTEDILTLVQPDAVQRYRTAQLAPFSVHHHLLLDAIELLTADAEPVRSGAVYDWYRRRCSETGTEPLTTRRIGDFLTQLELLHLIRVEHHYGGDRGKTRDIWLQDLG